ncbi:atherin-like [Sciurus carolinensis]|uniref:atherin-like n=1 Tax=Sciurus carolinensis TaxID=30640 RepID=UPI001FB30DDA|nr:atherin-like [Sciurus carolinensis]
MIGGWRPRTGDPNGGRPGWRRCPCGPAAPAPPAPPAARLSRCHVRPQQRGAGRVRPAAQAERSGPSAAAACPPPPPAPCSPPAASPAGRRSSSPLGRCELARFATLPPPGAARAVQVTALPRKREAERRAPGFPGLLPALSATRAGPRARDAPPRGTVRTADHPCAAPAKGMGDCRLPGIQSQTGAQEVRTRPSLPRLPSATGSPTPSVQGSGTGGPNTPAFLDLSVV